MLRVTMAALVLTAATLPLVADDDDRRWRYGDRGNDRWERRDDRRDDRWERRDDRSRGGWGGYGYSNAAVVDRTLSNLRRIASRNRVDSHERNHFERAAYHLERFRAEYSRDRRFNRDRLNDAIEHLDDLAKADQIHPRDREVLYRDLRDLRNFRSGGSGGFFGYR
jgi:hypothetical protein